MNNSLIITQTKLDMLQERVCRPTNYLATQVDSATPLWDGPIKMCQQIEADVFAVDSVVKEARKLKGKFNDNTTHLYQAVLCRVYIILYYLHNDDTLYKEIVFPRLRENMGLYNNKYLNSINEKIDKILEQEKLVKKIQEEKRKDVKPVFAYVAHKYEEKDYLRIEYNEEQLFRMMTDIIKQLVYIYSPTPDEIDVWFNAKKIVHTLRGLRRPELYVDAAVDALSKGQSAYGYDGSQIILICVYAMVRASKDNAYFDLFIKQMEDYASKEIRFDVIKKHIALVKKKLDAEPLPFEDYDYIGDQPKQTTYTGADLERYVSDYKVRLESLEKDKNEEIAKLRNEIEKKDKELEERFDSTEEKDNEWLQQAEKLRRAIQEIQKLKEDRTNLLAAFLKPAFYNDEKDARDFLKEIAGKDNQGVTDVARKWLHDGKITPSKKGRFIWDILRVAKLYDATEQNWTAAMRKKD